MSYGANRFNATIKPRSSLLDGLAAYWKFNEASGTRYDVHGQNHLTSINVGQADGKHGQAASFVAASSQYLSIPDNESLRAGDVPFTVAFWTKLTTNTASVTMVAKWNAAGDSNCEYIILYEPTQFNFFVTGDGNAFSTFNLVAATLPSPASNGTWYFVVCQHDPVSDLISISVDNAAPDTKAFSGGIYAGTRDFEVGRTHGFDYMNGEIDGLAFYRRLLTPGEIAQLYNGGKGREFPFLN